MEFINYTLLVDTRWLCVPVGRWSLPLDWQPYGASAIYRDDFRGNCLYKCHKLTTQFISIAFLTIKHFSKISELESNNRDMQHRPRYRGTKVQKSLSPPLPPWAHCQFETQGFLGHSRPKFHRGRVVQSSKLAQE